MGVVCSSKYEMINIEGDGGIIPKDEISLDESKITKIQTSVISKNLINSRTFWKI